MKTAISIPDGIFKAADRAAKKLGISRSELYAKAVKAYLETQDDRHITETLDRIYRREDSSVDPMLQSLQTASLRREEW